MIVNGCDSRERNGGSALCSADEQRPLGSMRECCTALLLLPNTLDESKSISWMRMQCHCFASILRRIKFDYEVPCRRRREYRKVDSYRNAR